MSEDSYNQQDTKAIFDYNTKEAELVRFLLEQEDEIEKKLFSYKGFKYSPEKERYVKVTEAKINDEGLDFASRNFRRYLNKNSATANLEDKQVSQLIISHGSELRQNMLDNMEAYGITKLSTIRELKNDICDQGFVLLTQSIKDKGRAFIHSGRKMTEVRSLSESSPDKSKTIGW